jgi:hypothetical protein
MFGAERGTEESHPNEGIAGELFGLLDGKIKTIATDDIAKCA